jgi:dihydroxy-acid dehydratase
MELLVDEAELTRRRVERDRLGWRPGKRERPLSAALRVYASMATSADKGAVRQAPD